MIVGITVGVLAGTIAALLFRTQARNDIARTNGSDRSVIEVEVEDDDDSPPAQPPDPGRRRILKQMVEGAKAEALWLKEFELTERSGKTVKSEDLRGEPYVACFFFTTCPGTCSRQSSKMQLLQNKFKGKPIKFVSISVDPDVDTPAVLRDYAEKYQADEQRWLFLTGPLDYIVKVGSEKFFLSGVEKRGHPDRFCLVNANGEVEGSYVWLFQEEFDQLLDHINEVLANSK
jgi:protein SCO1